MSSTANWTQTSGPSTSKCPTGSTPTYDARATDVGVVLREVSETIPRRRNLIGSPVLVVEVKSPSNRDRKMEQDAILHLTHGACAVLIVREENRQNRTGYRFFADRVRTG